MQEGHLLTGSLFSLMSPTNLLQVILVLAGSFWIAFFILPQLSRVASTIGLIDQPGKRKVHYCPKPLVGGIGIVVAVFVSSLLFMPPSQLSGVYAGIVLLVVVGFLDDFRELNYWWKFFAQIGAVILIIYLGKAVLRSFGDILSLGSIDLGILSLPLTLFCAVGVMNAVNMIDGLDGLAGGISLIAFVSFAILAYVNNQWEIMLFSIAFSGAVIAFLRYNWRARLFMGDAGSLTIGFTLAFLSIAVTQKEQSLVPPIAPLLILSVPIVDAMTTIVNRLMRGKSPFHADRTHFHHILLRLGFNQKRVLTIILSVSSIFSMVAIIGTIFKISEYYLFFLFLSYGILSLILSGCVKSLFKIQLLFKRRFTVSGEENITIKIGKILDKVAKIRRRYRRYRLPLPVSCYWKAGGQTLSSTSVHVGLGGFSTILPQSFLEGEKIAIDLYLGKDSQARVSTNAEVVWLTRVTNGYLHGFKFTRMDKIQAKTLSGFLNELS